ncbi:D-hexose-6-phosphate mutarotase [Acaryochloris sp. IP29b_bin.137]|uniref:D-hexose-6-phosphate mutarotase n=1 Tax=Acaryochloris sp. IP29b_bin.137 TaxID=2969217 RepID=UPI002629B08C|nr:D-hexose-6-phosphate mutarotase [Acaryochloris sp. IP29b_bin.137]
MTIEQLNADYGIAEHLHFSLGKGDFPLIHIDNPHAQASISVYAGQVLSYCPKAAEADLLFLSQNAYFQTGKAIKGGIPICWPWFGPDPEKLGRASHGFVRNRLWSVQSTMTTPEQATKVTLGLVNTPDTQEIWPYAFALSIEITVGQTLNIALITRNTGHQPFPLTQALHTYFQIGDINTVRVKGLEGKQYIDKVDGGHQKQQSGLVTLSEEVDRIYMDISPELVIEDPTLHRKIRIQSQGSQTAIVWNPWIDKAAQMADFANDEYQQMVCVETANAANDVVNLPPNGEHHLGVNYRVEAG